MTKKQIQPQGVTWAQAFRDIIVGSMSIGQLPLIGVFGIVGLMIYRLPPDKLGDLAEKTLDHLMRGEGIGYVLWLVTLIIGNGYINLIRSQFKSTAARLEAENERLASGRQHERVTKK